MRIHFVASTAFVILTSTAALASENDAYILQVGNRDKVYQTQEGFDDTAVAIQAGTEPGDPEPARRLDRQPGVSLQTGKLNTVKQTQGAEGASVDTFSPAGLRHRSRPARRSTFPASHRRRWRSRPAYAQHGDADRRSAADNLAASVQFGKDNFVVQTQGTIGETISPYTSTSPAGRGTIRTEDPDFSVGSFAASSGR